MDNKNLEENYVTLSEEDIKEIEKQLAKRMNYEDAEKEGKFQEQIQTILGDGMHGIQPVNELHKKKYLKIRNSLQDDQGFIEIEQKLPDITQMYNNEKSKMDELNKQKDQVNKPKTYFLNTRTNNEKNAYDAKIKEIDEQITKVEKLVKRLDNIEKNIKTLIPVYKITIEQLIEDIKRNGQEAMTAGKRKTRSNRKKSRKSRKSYKKSNHKK
jgi:hypothetical protein